MALAVERTTDLFSRKPKVVFLTVRPIPTLNCRFGLVWKVTSIEGAAVGANDGPVGEKVGALLGAGVGRGDGALEGRELGCPDGLSEGCMLGMLLG